MYSPSVGLPLLSSLMLLSNECTGKIPLLLNKPVETKANNL